METSCTSASTFDSLPLLPPENVCNGMRRMAFAWGIPYNQIENRVADIVRLRMLTETCTALTYLQAINELQTTLLLESAGNKNVAGAMLKNTQGQVR